MLTNWFKKRRRRKLLASPLPKEWLGCLQRNVRQYLRLSHQEELRLNELVQILVAEKHWEACDGLKITNEMKVTIAGQASLMLLGTTGDYAFDGVKTILVFPRAFDRQHRMQDGLLVSEQQSMLGEAWHRGPIVLSWPHVLAGGFGRDHGRNLVIHEFAHHLDGLDGSMGGTPPMASRRHKRRWYQVTEIEFRRLTQAAELGQATLLDHYGVGSSGVFRRGQRMFLRIAESNASTTSRVLRNLERFLSRRPKSLGWER